MFMEQHKSILLIYAWHEMQSIIRFPEEVLVQRSSLRHGSFLLQNTRLPLKGQLVHPAFTKKLDSDTYPCHHAGFSLSPCRVTASLLDV